MMMPALAARPPHLDKDVACVLMLVLLSKGPPQAQVDVQGAGSRLLLQGCLVLGRCLCRAPSCCMHVPQEHVRADVVGGRQPSGLMRLSHGLCREGGGFRPSRVGRCGACYLEESLKQPERCSQASSDSLP